ncbi:BTAD domain-containing putative transcriptional regulator [Sphaerisporangium flaviroseum]|uniref:BTAD domain-containing putative transcriptional regulator n=1 Tax=Sphaerisporangium flaviroseum TaxID=509199 RepID=A0ABP7J8W2_9ACTN
MLQFRLLGPVEVVTSTGPVALGGRKPRTLLVTLLLSIGKVVTASRLVDAVWGDDPPEAARGLIQTYVSMLRKAFAEHGYPEVIESRHRGYVIAADAGTLDATLFQRLSAEAKSRAERGDFERASTLWRQAEALWHGPALDGLDTHAVEARHLQQLRVSAAEDRMAACLASGGLDHADELSRLVDLHPANERLRGQLMITLYRLNRQADALECFRQGRQLLIDQIGVEPGADLASIHTAILRNDPKLLKAAAAAPREQPHQPVTPAQLPSAPADFTGRRAELDALATALGGGGIQVVSGQGGSGKTALALSAAHRTAPRFPDGQLFAELRGMSPSPAPVGDVLARFLKALHVETEHLPGSDEERAELYRSLVANRRMLVVLDDAADERQVRPLLPGAPDSAVLVTSRNRLASLPGAALVELTMLPDQEAHQLLEHIVGQERIAADPEAAARITAACGNLPLAIRVAGGRLAARRRLPLAVLADRLSDERRRLDELSIGDLAVRSTISLSYQALDPPARMALRRVAYLGVPDFSAWSVSWLMDVSLPEAEDALERLVDEQLVDFAGVDALGRLRYRRHDLVALFGRERAELEESAEELCAAVSRVLTHWLALVESIAAKSPPAVIRWRQTPVPAVTLPEPVVARVLAEPQRWLDIEAAALVVGVERAATLGLHELAYRFTSARKLVEFEGANRFEFRARIISAALAASRLAGHRYGTATMLAELAQLRYDQDLFAESRQHFGEALSLFRDLGDAHGQATALAGLGIACREPGHLTEAVHFLDQAAALLDALGDRGGVGYARRLSGSVRLEQGDYPGAYADLQESLEAYHSVGSHRGVAYAMRSLGLYYRARGEYDAALQSFERAADTFRKLGDVVMHSYAVRALAKTELRLGRHAEALERLSWSLGVVRAARDRWGEALTLRVLGQAHLVCGRLCEAESCLLESLALWDTMQTPLWRARTLHDLALLYRRRGEHERAEAADAEARKTFQDLGAREFHELFEPPA